MERLLKFALALLAVTAAYGQDPVADLARRMEQGTTRLAFHPVYGYLPALLDALRVPVESQIAVFSKTSIQLLRIEPSNPRVLYFNDSVAVGWVRGGFIELAAQGPGRAIGFYTLQQRPDEKLARRDVCLSCHKSAVTLFRSVIASPTGVATAEMDTDDRTPFAQLWGGWFVTGKPPREHRGNAVFANGEARELIPSLDAKCGLLPSSDPVALLVFAHQMRVMNLLEHPNDPNELADALLFVNEAPLPGPVRGDSGFAEKFSAAGTRDRYGRSLRDFDLKTKLMRYPFSYMIESEAFDGLAPSKKAGVYQRIWRTLSGTAPYRTFTAEDGQAALDILRATKKDLPGYFLAAR